MMRYTRRMTRHAQDPARALALIELERSEVDHLGDSALATCIRAAQRLDVPMTSTALAGGLTRTRAYGLLERTEQQRPASLSATQMRRLAACQLALDTSIALRALAAELRVDVDGLSDALRWLRERGVAEVLAVTQHVDGTPMDQHWIAGPRRDGWIAAELDALRWVTSHRFAVYVRLPDGIGQEVSVEAHRISTATTTVINAGTSHAITWDELAIAVAASDPREALDTARDVWTQAVTKIAPKSGFDVTCVLAPSGA